MRASNVWLVALALWLGACSPAEQGGGLSMGCAPSTPGIFAPLDLGVGAPPMEVCVKVGERCKLGGGKLGVCHADPKEMARLVCLSQH